MARSVSKTALNSNSAIHKVGAKATMMKVADPKKNARKKASPKRSRSGRAGLVFPVGRINTKLHKRIRNKRISVGASVFMAGVLEYLSAELLESAGEITKKLKKHRVAPRHVMLAARVDEEFAELLREVIISEAGVEPKPIHVSLLPKM